MPLPAGTRLGPYEILSPDLAGGNRIAFFDFEENRVHVTDLLGKELANSSPEGGVRSLAWSSSGAEIWFTVGSGGGSTLRAMSVSGKERVLLRIPRGMNLQDVSRDGKVLMEFASDRNEV